MRNYLTYEWFTIATVIGLIAIVAAKFINSLRFQDFLNVVGNSKYLKIYSKDQKFIDQFDSFLFINLTLSLSIFVFYTFSEFITPLTFDLTVYFKLVFSIGAVILIKILLERLVGSLFSVDNLIDNYLFQKTTFKNYSGFVFLIANLFLIYIDTYHKTIIIAAICLVCIINLIGFFTSFKNYQKLISFNFFYFLLYLCALEIGPYVILYKVITDYNA